MSILQHITPVISWITSTWKKQVVKIDQCIQLEYISDHRIIDCKNTLEKESIVNWEVLYRDVNSTIIEDFMVDLSFNYGDTPTLQAVVDSFNKSLLEASDKHAPLVTKKIPVRWKVPWFDSKVRDPKAGNEEKRNVMEKA